MAAARSGTRQDSVNKASPAFQKAKLGDVVQELTDQLNTLTAKYNLLLAKLDTETQLTFKTNYVTTFSAPATSITSMEKR